jgi:TonB-dependent starch-binding outer membrane protein SusC
MHFHEEGSMLASVVRRPTARFRAATLGTLLAVLAATAPPGGLAAQTPATGVIRGRVVVEGTNRPLGAVQVLVVGSTLGAQTNDAGEYRIPNVPAGARTVRTQRIGFQPATQAVTVTAGGTVTADFTIRDAPVALDQVVVTATGEQRKKEITNSVATVSTEAIAAPVTNTQQLITAQAPGITVLGNSGQPGAGGRIMLRGVNSISQGNNPIIYVDGVRIFSGTAPRSGMARQGTNPFNDIKPDDIERVEIVKGASATTLYGTEASSGVIQIFTKRGRMGTPRWNVEATAGTNDLKQMGPDGDPTGLFVKQCRGPELYGLNVTSTSAQFGQDVPFEDPTCPESGSWLRTGLVQRYSANVAGGSDVARYFLSGNWGSEEGAIPSNVLNEGGLRGNFSFRPVQSLDVALNSSYQKRKQHWIPDGNFAQGFLLNVGRGYSNNYKSPASSCSQTAQFCLANAEILRQAPITRADHYITGLTLNHTPSDVVSNRLSVGYDYSTNENRQITPFGQLNNPAGSISQADWSRRFLSLDYAGTLTNRFRETLKSDFSWGGQLFQDDLRSISVSGTVFSGPGDPLVSTSARPLFSDDDRRRVINAGIFLQEQLGWNDRLFVTAGLRVDGNSAFGKDFGLQTYPKLGVSYVLSDHEFFPSSWWETLKLRGAIGESGKAPGAFDAVRTWDPTSGDDGKPAVTPNQIGNPTLGPERTRELELGLESSMWGGRLAVDLNYFNTRTLDALIQVRYPPSQGFLSTQLENVGTLLNQGVELKLEGAPIRNERVEWRGRVNYTRMTNEAVDLGGVTEISIGTATVVREGYPVPAIFGRKVLNPNDFANPIVTDTAVHLGRTFPNEIIGLGSTLTLWGRLTLDGLGEFQNGGMNINFVGYQNENRGVWRGCYDVQRKLIAAMRGNAAAVSDVRAIDRARCAVDRTVQNSDFWIEPTDFFRLRYVSATYAIPARFLRGTQSASITLAGRNLLTSTDYSGLDPESADQSDNTFARREYYQLPTLRSFTLSAKVTF